MQAACEGLHFDLAGGIMILPHIAFAEVYFCGEFMENRIIIGMSGGVDSSVAAMLLKKQGLDVIGVFMKNWNEEDPETGACTAVDDYDDVRRTAEAIGIPYYTVNFTKEYYDRVFTYFLDEYKNGRTPNPDVLCNCEIKFKAFLDFALGVGSNGIATGHYARVLKTCDGVMLRKAADLSKDQTYFLAGLVQDQIKNAVFPIGDLHKTQVRTMAAEAGLVNAAKKDSTGVCFIGERNFKKFLMQYLPAQPGDIIDLDGNKVGRHDGLMYYTLGQRRGLGIGGLKAGNGESFFVVDKDMKNNRLIVRQGEGKELYSHALDAKNVSYICTEPTAERFRCMAKFRYRQDDTPVTVTKIEGGIHIDFDEPQRAVTPGQWAVLYDGEICLGGGIIENVYKV